MVGLVQREMAGTRLALNWQQSGARLVPGNGKMEYQKKGKCTGCLRFCLAWSKPSLKTLKPEDKPWSKPLFESND